MALKTATGKKKVMERDWMREYLGTWIADEHALDQFRFKVAADYFARCDAYDEQVCTSRSPRTGEAIPTNGDELGAINWNAHQVIKDLAREYALTREAVFLAIHDYSRYERRR